MLIGITGGFLGSYKTVPFHQRVRDYGVLEDRDLWMVQLRLSDDEHHALEQVIAEEEGRHYPYTYFSRNCAFYIQRLLARALPDIPEPGGRVSPMGVLERAISQNRAAASYYRPALSLRLCSQVDDLPAEVRSRINSTEWRDLAADHEWLRGLERSSRLFLQEFFQWKSLHHDVPLNTDAENGLALLRVLSARQSEVSIDISSTRTPGQPRPFPDFHAYSRLTVSTWMRANREPTLAIRYRPALHGVRDPWRGHRPVNTLEILTLTVSTAENGDYPQLEELLLFSQRSLTPMSVVRRNRSWMLEIATRRGGVLGSERLHHGLRAGLGYTYQSRDSLYLSLLANGAVLGAVDEGTRLAQGLQVGILYLASDSWRLGAQCDWQREALGNGRTWTAGETWIRVDSGGNWGIAVRLTADNVTHGLRMDVCRYL